MTAAEQLPAIERGPGRPKGGAYRLADGSRAESVTKILKHLGSPEGLIHYTRSTTLEALEEGASPKAAVYEGHRRMRDSGAHGTRIHEAIEALEQGRPVPIGTARAVRHYRAWMREKGLVMIGMEIPLVSERLRLGGTIDWVMRHESGGLWLGDLKTGRSMHASHLYQLALYSLMWSEVRGEQVGDVAVLHLPKDAPTERHGCRLGGSQLRRLERDAERALQVVRDFRALGVQVKSK